MLNHATAGRYAFYCKNKLPFFKSHREIGQEGILKVVQNILEPWTREIQD